jgi:hypothetical protein
MLYHPRGHIGLRLLDRRRAVGGHPRRPAQDRRAPARPAPRRTAPLSSSFSLSLCQGREEQEAARSKGRERQRNTGAGRRLRRGPRADRLQKKTRDDDSDHTLWDGLQVPPPPSPRRAPGSAPLARTPAAHRRACATFRSAQRGATSYDAFGDNRTSLRELEWKTPIFCGREVRKTPNALYACRCASFRRAVRGAGRRQMCHHRAAQVVMGEPFCVRWLLPLPGAAAAESTSRMRSWLASRNMCTRNRASKYPYLLATPLEPWAD